MATLIEALLPFSIIVFSVTILLCFYVSFLMIKCLYSMQQFMNYIKDFMVDTQYYTYNAMDSTYKIKDLIKEMRDKFFNDFIEHKLKK